jgi:hypothetical protein
MLESTNNCPYLKRVDDEIRYEIAGYCERSSVCALRVPTLGELNTYCMTGDYRHCPIYRMGIEAESRDVGESKKTAH